MDFLETARRLIAIDSTPANGTKDVAKFAAELCREAGLFVELQEGVVKGIAQANVIARPTEQRPDEEVLFQSHLDTVDPGSYSLWTETDRNPFNATIKDGKIYGVGAAEVKLDFLCKLMAMKSLKKNSFKKPFVLVGSYGEEIGMWGAKQIIKDKKVSARVAVLGKPTEMKLVYASNGISVVEVHIPFSAEEKKYRADHETSESTSSHSRIFRGKAAHSSTPHLGENAILKLIRYLDQLPAGIAILSVDGGTSHNVIPDQALLEVDLSASFKDGVSRKLVRIVNEMETIATEFVRYPAEGFDPPYPTFNVGLIRSDLEGVQLIGSIRVTPSVSEELWMGWLNRFKQTCAELGGYAKMKDFKSSARVDQNSFLVRACIEELSKLGASPIPVTKVASNESSIYSPRGIECVAIGPGKGLGNSHCPNEFNTLQELDFAVEFYKRAIERLCS